MKHRVKSCVRNVLLEIVIFRRINFLIGGYVTKLIQLTHDDFLNILRQSQIQVAKSRKLHSRSNFHNSGGILRKNGLIVDICDLVRRCACSAWNAGGVICRKMNVCEVMQENSDEQKTHHIEVIVEFVVMRHADWFRSSNVALNNRHDRIGGSSGGGVTEARTLRSRYVSYTLSDWALCSKLCITVILSRTRKLEPSSTVERHCTRTRRSNANCRKIRRRSGCCRGTEADFSGKIPIG